MKRSNNGASPAQRDWAAKTKESSHAKQLREDHFTAKLRELSLLGKTVEEWSHNAALIQWVKTFKDRLYIPEDLLRILKLTPDLTCGGRFMDWDFDENGPAETYTCTYKLKHGAR